jgi:Ser/Thr protein kinase RdoA (MazF antagonist)
VLGFRHKSTTRQVTDATATWNRYLAVMSNSAAELPLTGGRVTPGVVQVGDTLRRPASPASPFVEQLLNHLARKGFAGCPKHLGWDEQGRETLSFLPGHIPPRWQRFTDDQVAAAAGLLRQLHDATRDLASGLSSEVICHHDPGPNNTVFRDGCPVAFIDFDFAAPGHPLEDLGYLAWAWCISSRPDRGPVAEQARQVRILADAYQLTTTDRQRLPAAIEARHRRNEQLCLTMLKEPQTSPAQRVYAQDVVTWTRREAAYTLEHRNAFIHSLTGQPNRRSGVEAITR